MTGRTLLDLEDALKRLEKAWQVFGPVSANDLAAPPTALDEAAAEVRAIERDLKRAGVIPSTDHELLELRLDSAFPDAASHEVVKHDDKNYKRRFFPMRKSRKGKVLEWGRSWVEVPTLV